MKKHLPIKFFCFIFTALFALSFFSFKKAEASSYISLYVAYSIPLGSTVPCAEESDESIRTCEVEPGNTYSTSATAEWGAGFPSPLPALGAGGVGSNSFPLGYLPESYPITCTASGGTGSGNSDGSKICERTFNSNRVGAGTVDFTFKVDAGAVRGERYLISFSTNGGSNTLTENFYIRVKPLVTTVVSPRTCVIKDFSPNPLSPSYGSTAELRFMLDGTFRWSVVSLKDTSEKYRYEEIVAKNNNAAGDASGTIFTTPTSGDQTYQFICHDDSKDEPTRTTIVYHRSNNVFCTITPSFVSKSQPATVQVTGADSRSYPWTWSTADASASPRSGSGSSLPGNFPVSFGSPGKKVVRVTTPGQISPNNCEVTVVEGPACSADVDPVTLGYAAKFTGFLGKTPYSWSAPGATTISGSGNTFTTSYGSVEKKIITIKDSLGKESTCEVSIVTKPIAWIKANPNPISSCGSYGSTEISAFAEVDYNIRVNSASGPVLASMPAGSTYSKIVSWIEDDMKFYLVKAGTTDLIPGSTNPLTITFICDGGCDLSKSHLQCGKSGVCERVPNTATACTDTCSGVGSVCAVTCDVNATKVCNDFNSCTTDDRVQCDGTCRGNVIGGTHKACSGTSCLDVSNTRYACSDTCGSNSETPLCRVIDAKTACNDGRACTDAEFIDPITGKCGGGEVQQGSHCEAGACVPNTATTCSRTSGISACTVSADCAPQPPIVSIDITPKVQYILSGQTAVYRAIPKINKTGIIFSSISATKWPNPGCYSACSVNVYTAPLNSGLTGWNREYDVSTRHTAIESVSVKVTAEAKTGTESWQCDSSIPGNKCWHTETVTFGVVSGLMDDADWLQGTGASDGLVATLGNAPDDTITVNAGETKLGGSALMQNTGTSHWCAPPQEYCPKAYEMVAVSSPGVPTGIWGQKIAPLKVGNANVGDKFRKSNVQIIYFELSNAVIKGAEVYAEKGCTVSPCLYPSPIGYSVQDGPDLNGRPAPSSSDPITGSFFMTSVNGAIPITTIRFTMAAPPGPGVSTIRIYTREGVTYTKVVDEIEASEEPKRVWDFCLPGQCYDPHVIEHYSYDNQVMQYSYMGPGHKQDFEIRGTPWGGTLKAPTTPGTYYLKWQMRKGGNEYFGDVAEQTIIVREAIGGNASVEIKANNLKTDGSCGANCITIPYNTPADLSWTYSNATSCTITAPGFIGGYPGRSDSISTGNLTLGRTYNISCDPGSVNDSVKVNVGVAPDNSLTVKRVGQGTVTGTSKPSQSNINCKASCTTQTKIYTPGTEITLTAKPALGRIFTGWSGSTCSGRTTGGIVKVNSDGSASCGPFLMDTIRNVTANFAIDPNYVEF